MCTSTLLEVLAAAAGIIGSGQQQQLRPLAVCRYSWPDPMMCSGDAKEGFPLS